MRNIIINHILFTSVTLVPRHFNGVMKVAFYPISHSQIFEVFYAIEVNFIVIDVLELFYCCTSEIILRVVN